MSLINDALKKAQRDRENPDGAQAAAPKPVPAPVATGPRPGNPAAAPSFKVMKWVVGGSMLVAGVAAAVIFLTVLMRKDPPPQVELPREVAVRIKLKEPVPESIVTSDTPTTPAPAPSTPRVVVEEEAIAFQVPEVTEPLAVAPPKAPQPEAAPKPQPVPVATPTALAPTPPASPVVVNTPPPTPPPVLPEPAAEPPAIAFQLPSQPVLVGGEEAPAVIEAKPLPEAAPEAQANPKVVAFLEASRITGIKVAGTQSRVLLNNQVFKTGSLVDPATQLRIKTIKPNEIEFVDESGLEYRKQFQR